MGLIFFTIVVGIIGLIIFSNSEDASTKNEVVSKKSDDENFYRDSAEDSSFSSSDDDFSSIHLINPASGAPMIGEGTCGVDTLGNSYGNDDDIFNGDDNFHHTDI